MKAYRAAVFFAAVGLIFTAVEADPPDKSQPKSEIGAPFPVGQKIAEMLCPNAARIVIAAHKNGGNFTARDLRRQRRHRRAALRGVVAIGYVAVHDQAVGRAAARRRKRR